MKIGAFQIDEPLPELREPHALALLSPWIDVCDVGSVTLRLMETYLNAQPLGELIRPGNFFDFTRYRPVIHLVKGLREVEIPNSFIHYAQRQRGNDFIFFHLLEPHAHGEEYAESILKVLQKFKVKRYCLVGSMYDAVPHTRPLIVSGTALGSVEMELRKLGVQPSSYEGPTTIAILVSQQAQKYEIEVASMIVHLPQYVRLEKDYTGVLSLTELLCTLYGLPIELQELRKKAQSQREEINLAVEKEPQLKEAVQQLEEYYEALSKGEKEPGLSSEIEEFLREATEHFEAS